jgi:hypothetical protein
MRLRLLNPGWGRLPTLALVLCVLSAPAFAQPRGKGGKKPPKPPTPPAETVGADDTKDKDTAKQEKLDAPAPTLPAKKGPVKEQNFNFEGLGLNGRSRSPQLLYFLERANEELERASLQKRSFIPHMVRSLEEEKL